MPFPYKTVLILGATSGIGHDLAEKLISHNIFVIAVGRRQANLDALVEKHGSSKVASITFDITNLDGIPSFMETVTKAHPTLDCVVINAGIQRRLNFAAPHSINLARVNQELTTNYLAPVHIATAFLPFLEAQDMPTSLIFVSSALGLVPAVPVGNYSASKAAIHALIMTMREQLRGGNVKIIEVIPPAVQTELHSAHNQPEIKNGDAFGMPLAEFTEEAWRGLEDGLETVPVGIAKKSAESWEKQRLEIFHQMAKFMRERGMN